MFSWANQRQMEFRNCLFMTWRLGILASQGRLPQVIPRPRWCVLIDTTFRRHIFKIHKSDQSKEVIVRWTPTDKRTRGAWANENDATRDGAYACVLAAVELLCGLTAIRRSETETGADYYIAEPNAAVDDLESYIRLEVSGVDRGNASRVASRLRQKLDQARSGKSDLPAMAGVVGYRARLIRLAPA